MSIAQAFPVGEHLEEELEAHGWSQAEFAEIIQRPTQFVSEVISGKKELTRESAAQIAAAFGTSTEYWLNLQNRYLLGQQSQDKGLQSQLTDVQRRARLNDLAPVSLLRKRGIIAEGSLAQTEAQIIQLFGLGTIDDEPEFKAVARRSNEHEETTKLQRAWLAVIKNKARSQQLPVFDPAGFNTFARRISQIVATPAAFASLPQQFREHGVALLYEESFPGSKLDGVSFLQDGNPVIALSGRGKRLDKVLFTLLHEVAHILNGDLKEGEIRVDTGINETAGVQGLDDQERAADELAAELTFPNHEFSDPPSRVRSAWIQAEADKHHVHPVVVIGRLQKMGNLDWRTVLAKGAPTVEPQLASWKYPF